MQLKNTGFTKSVAEVNNKEGGNLMLAAVLEDIKHIELKEVPKPEPGYGETIVKVKACGICQTDFKAYTGERKNFTPPIIVGHEISGIVSEVGKGVKNFREGDEVIVSPAIYCGKCDYCKSGLEHYCVNGAVIGGDGFDDVRDGGFAEYVVVPETNLYKKPKQVSFSAAALAEPLAGSYKGMIEYSNLRLGEDVVIIGAGSMGLLLTQVASAAGAATLILIDIEDYKLEYAKKCGATHVINSKKESPREKVYDILPKGPDVIFEAAGVLDAASLAFDLCRRGSRINMFGVTTPGTIPVSPGHIHFTEIAMDASFSVTPRTMLKSVKLMEKGLVDTSKIITHEFPLHEISKALETMNLPERIKIVIKP